MRAFATRKRVNVSLVAMFSQCPSDRLRCRLIDNTGATEVPFPLVTHPCLQVASTTLAVLRLTLGGEAESLFGALMGLHFGHNNTLA